MDNFWTLLKESVVTQALLTLGLAGACIFMWTTGKPIPDGLLTAFSTVLGFYFGAKFQYLVNKAG